MSHHMQRKFRSGTVPLGLVLALVVVAVPFAASAAAQRPGIHANSCAPVARNVPPAPGQPRADCDERAAAIREATGKTTGGSGGTDAGIIAGGAALLALMSVGGLLVAMRRRRAPRTRPATQT
ncbi:MAG: hypothetical protein ACRDPL_00155 [Propionibacteriaceae bacterium]